MGVTYIKLGHKKARKMMRKNNNNNSRIYFGLVSNIDLSVQENHEKLVVLVQRVAKLLRKGSYNSTRAEAFKGKNKPNKPQGLAS